MPISGSEFSTVTNVMLPPSGQRRAAQEQDVTFHFQTDYKFRKRK